MNGGVVQLNLIQFGLVYLLLLVVLAIMKKARIKQTKLLVLASVRMTLQLVLAGLVLTYIMQNPSPWFTAAYLLAMFVFALYRILKPRPELNRRFRVAVALSLFLSGLTVTVFFICAVVGVRFFDPQYTIPISGMIIGNSMTGLTLGLKTFTESLKEQSARIESLLNLGATPHKILLPFVNSALETALLPTLNSMLGMGIIALPGMMTGQILSGTAPTTAILYQIAIMIAICATVCLSVFCSLYFGHRTLYNKKNQIAV